MGFALAFEAERVTTRAVHVSTSTRVAENSSTTRRTIFHCFVVFDKRHLLELHLRSEEERRS
jgi:hypothetical protein